MACGAAGTGSCPRRQPQNAAPFAAEAADLRERLTLAVKRHLMSDVPLGVFLSGGIDSSALAAIVSKMAAPPLRTFAVGFADREANELGYARQVADWIGAEHREVVVSPDQFFEALPRLIWHEDEPIAFPSSVPLYFVSRLAAEHVKVVLTGEGADELFLGYNRYRVTHWNERLGAAVLVVHAGGCPATAARPGSPPAGAARPYAEAHLPRRRRGHPQSVLENFAVFTRTPAAWAPATARDDGRPPRARARSTRGDDGDLLDRMGRSDLQTYLHELLMKQDQMSMAASIESRVPFLDDRLVEHVAALPSSFKVRGWQTKAILREAVRDLVPPAILSRRKMGFPVPVGRWLRGAFQPLVNEFVLGPRAAERHCSMPRRFARMAAEQASGAARHGDRLWLLINLEIWQRIFLDGESPELVMSAASPRESKAA